MIKKDCFAYNDNATIENEKCSALKKLYCTVEKCKFYKTKEQLEKECKKNAI